MTRGFLSGKKTYIAAGVTLLAAWAGFAAGEPVLGQDALTLADAVQMTAIALIGAFLRSGIANDTK
jgi:hypothetical protein